MGKNEKKKKSIKKWGMVNHILSFIWSIAIAIFLLEILKMVKTYSPGNYSSIEMVITKIAASALIIIKCSLDLRSHIKENSKKNHKKI